MIETKTFAVVLLMAIATVGAIGASIVTTAFADPNQGAPGQGLPDHRNPSGGDQPPGQTSFAFGGNSGQCQKIIGSHTTGPAGCFTNQGP